MSSRDYGYGHSYWKDQLTSWGSYGTSSFAYDDSGNPTKYKGKTLEWEGKRLTRYNESDMKYTDLSYDGNGLLAGYFYSNTYSIWGGATFTTTMTREILRDGDRILSEKVTEYNPETNSTTVKNIMYAYDEKGVSGMTVGGKKYYFVRNIFGDVTAIYNTSRVKCAEYAYDAWGTMYMTLDTEGVGALNPFRYRGYYMVSCIGLYYLTTRFYDYTTGRFLNADVPSVGIESGFNIPEGCNLYSYCRNNPILYFDPTGHFAISTLLISFAIGTLVSWGISEIFGVQIAGGISSMINGGSAIHTGIGLLSFGPMGWIIGGALILAGIGTMAFGLNEIVSGTIGKNEVRNWMGGNLYDGLYIGLNVTSSIGTILGNVYMKFNPRYPGNNPNKIPDGFQNRANPKANYYNPNTGQSLRPDLQHPAPIKPHWDWRDSNGVWWRLYRFFRKRK